MSKRRRSKPDQGNVLWHYTTGSNGMKIILSGMIKLTSSRCEGGKSAVWLSTNQDWEPAIARDITDENGRRGATVEEMLKWEHYLIRFGVADNLPELISWDEYKQTSGIDSEVAESEEKRCQALGSCTESWFASYKPIPRHLWVAVQWSDGSGWTDVPRSSWMIADPAFTVACDDADRHDRFETLCHLVWRHIPSESQEQITALCTTEETGDWAGVRYPIIACCSCSQCPLPSAGRCIPHLINGQISTYCGVVFDMMPDTIFEQLIAFNLAGILEIAARKGRVPTHRRVLDMRQSMISKANAWGFDATSALAWLVDNEQAIQRETEQAFELDRAGTDRSSTSTKTSAESSSDDA